MYPQRAWELARTPVLHWPAAYIQAHVSEIDHGTRKFTYMHRQKNKKAKKHVCCPALPCS